MSNPQEPQRWDFKEVPLTPEEAQALKEKLITEAQERVDEALEDLEAAKCAALEKTHRVWLQVFPTDPEWAAARFQSGEVQLLHSFNFSPH